MQKTEHVHWWFVSRRRILAKILNSHLKPMDNRTVLEIGCGTGGNLQVLSRFGALSAMELDDSALKWAKEKKLCTVKKGSLPFDIPFENRFDLVCMLDVLEHIEDDERSLAEVRKILNPEGHLLLTVPAFDFLWNDNDVVNHHVRRYSKNKLVERLRQSGYQVKYCTYFNTFLFPMALANIFFNKIFNRKSGSGAVLPSKIVNHIFKIIFTSERVFLPNLSFPLGVSLLVFAENQEQQFRPTIHI